MAGFQMSPESGKFPPKHWCAHCQAMTDNLVPRGLDSGVSSGTTSNFHCVRLAVLLVNSNRLCGDRLARASAS